MGMGAAGRSKTKQADHWKPFGRNPPSRWKSSLAQVHVDAKSFFSRFLSDFFFKGHAQLDAGNWGSGRFLGWNTPILMKLGVWYLLTHRLMHSEFRGSRTIFNFGFSWGPPFGFVVEIHGWYMKKNPKGGPHENLKLKIVLDPRNSLCINLLVSKYLISSFIKIAHWEVENLPDPQFPTSSWASPFEENKQPTSTLSLVL